MEMEGGRSEDLVRLTVRDDVDWEHGRRWQSEPALPILPPSASKSPPVPSKFEAKPGTQRGTELLEWGTFRTDSFNYSKPKALGWNKPQQQDPG